jgi:DNA-binding PucR family transcriptional regulator
MVRCLYYYLINGKNIAAAAKALFTHRTTLIYRLKKLSGILNADINILNSRQSFFLLLSCVIARHGIS